MKNENKTDWTDVLLMLIICVTILLSGAKCTYRQPSDLAPVSVSLNAD